MSKVKLTPKQERFVQNVFKGMSQLDAYKDSYKVKTMSDKTIREEACKLFNSPKISTRYQELVDKLEKKTILTAEQRMQWLSDVITNNVKEDIYINVDGKEKKIGERNADISTKLKSLDTLNKMTGEYITKVEGDLNVTKLEDLL